MNIRWATGLLIIAAVVAFQTVWADEVQPVKRDKLEIIGTVLYADTNKPVVPGKWFYVVETFRTSMY